MGILPYRQIHLDFHTGAEIEHIGAKFDAEEWIRTLTQAHVSGMTVFSKCHHGYSYHPTEVGEKHPHLAFDLLGAELDCLKRANIRACVYLSAGFDERLAKLHPEWWVRDAKGHSLSLPDDDAAGYHLLCFRTDYLDVLVKETEEVARKYPCAGFFLDISNVVPCRCETCRKEMLRLCVDVLDDTQVMQFQEEVYLNYTNRIRDAIHKYQPNATIFHNAGHVPKGNERMYEVHTHFELESLPTGGWGYDHFPFSAAWAMTTGREFVGMTGKFHTAWGEFGGYKHPNALMYETALSIALGAKCSIGDQLHPSGKLDDETYCVIGKAYERIEQFEEYLKDAEWQADIGLLSYEGRLRNVYQPFGENRTISDIGCVRMLLEKHYLFQVIDDSADFSRYKLLILPDKIRVDQSLEKKLNDYLAKGGKILATGESLLRGDDTFACGLDLRFGGTESFRPLYCGLDKEILSEHGANYVFYSPSYQVKGDGCGGKLVYPYFNRTKEHFCSHQHAPYSDKTGSDLIFYNKDRSVCYLPLNIFEEYATVGSYIMRDLAAYATDSLMTRKVVADLPTQGIVTFASQGSRDILHLLYASPVKRGNGVEIIEDIVPLRDVAVRVMTDHCVQSVTVVPQNLSLSFTCADGELKFSVPQLWCNQVICIQYAV